MSSPDFLLYVDADFLSPYAMSAFVTLHEKGLPFEIKTLNLAARENHEAGFVAASLTRWEPHRTRTCAMMPAHAGGLYVRRQ